MNSKFNEQIDFLHNGLEKLRDIYKDEKAQPVKEKLDALISGISNPDDIIDKKSCQQCKKEKERDEKHIEKTVHDM